MKAPIQILALALLALLLPAPALAHGPGMAVSYAGVKPEQLVIRVGDTVHFLNRNAAAGDCTLVSEDGSFESPTLGRGGDWHHTFETVGEHVFFVREMPGVRGRVSVVAE